MNPQEIRQALISIIIGACVAFLTSLIDGIGDLLHGHFPNAVGGTATTGAYLSQALRRPLT